ncbi:MAG: cytochrome c [Chloroflexaceae bacterium]|nr:cytochrome c [Chloroflexaceae bacterium]NJL34380.1 cytochrome c [Chloroflexaceae bacterium]NJO04496.1 cytochrome c [Chloroflexaceae bacterium]
MNTRSNLPATMFRAGWLLALVVLLAGCGEMFAFRQWMYNQAKEETYEESEFFADRRSARVPVAGTVAQGETRTDEFFYTGLVNGQEVDALPFPVTEAMLNRGEQQYNTFCSPCHGLSGYGNGMVARRGGTPPSNYHSEYLRSKSLSHYYNVITNGYRNMMPYDQKIAPEDRWAIAAYIRALQLSQNATPEDVPPDQLNQLQGMGQ